MVNVRFIDTTRNINKAYAPKPAKNNLPEWYKKMPSFAKDLPGVTEEDRKFFLDRSGVNGPPTVKKCMPVFDTITAGYHLFTHADFLIFSKDNDPYPWYRWSDSDDVVDFHDYYQIAGYPVKPEEKGRRVGRYYNPWSIVTPKGYSCLIVPPMHRESNLRILPGIVDTDTYHGPIQLPFFLVDPEWRDLVPAGTPIAQVIPFKRDSFTHTIEEDDPYDSLFTKTHRLIRSKFYNVYKSFMWSKKEYN